MQKKQKQTQNTTFAQICTAKKKSSDFNSGFYNNKYFKYYTISLLNSEILLRIIALTRDIEIKNIVAIARGEWGGGSGERGL